MGTGPIDISQLKSNAKPQQPVDNTGKNVDGTELRDFGDGLKEFDPSANGFKMEEPKFAKSDKDKALEACDQMFNKMEKEVQIYNELLEAGDGQVTEEELREALGQSQITGMLHDGAGQKFEENPTNKVEVDSSPAQEPVQTNTQSQELDELENELSEDEGYYEEETPVEGMTLAPNQVEQKSKTAAMAEAIKEATPAVNTTVNEPKPEAEPVMVAMVAQTPTKETLGTEDADLAALEDDFAPPVDDFEEKLRAELAKKMHPVAKKYDISTMSVVAQPVMASSVINKIAPMTGKTFTWALPRSKRPVVMRSFTATELNDLNSRVSNKSVITEVFKTIWNHIEAGKGRDFDAWTKCTSYFDVNHLWFAIYGACFQDSNYIPATCQECGGVTIAENVPIYDMCKFSTPEFKEEFETIRNTPITPEMGSVFAEQRVQITDNLVIGFKEPTIYDAVIAPNSYDSEFREKYSDIIGIMTYISNMYEIRETANGPALFKVATRVFNNNDVKTAKAKVIQYAKILRSLRSDQYNIIIAFISSMNEEDKLTYQVPAVSCDHCKKEIPAEDSAAVDLVFIRHQLALLGI